MGKPFKPSKPLSPASIGRLISIFFFREGEECPAAKEANRLLTSEIGKGDADLHATVLEQLHTLGDIHQAFDGTRVDHRSRAAKHRESKE